MEAAMNTLEFPKVRMINSLAQIPRIALREDTSIIPLSIVR
jgi:hypothetical protein